MGVTIDRVAAGQLGLITRRQLLSAGLSASGIDSRVAAGRLFVVHPGVYLVPAAPRSWEQGLLAAWLASGPASAISHVAAGVVWNLERVDAAQPQIVIPHPRRLRLEGVVVHRTRTLERNDLVRRDLIRVTTPTRTIVDLAGALAPDLLEDALDDALRRRLTSVPTLERRLERLGNRGVPGSGVLRRLLRERSGIRVSDSGLENRFKRRLQRAGLPLPVAQYEVRDERRRLIARVDFAYPAQRLAIEIDGYGNHSGRKNWESDLARQNRLVVVGWRFLRFTHRDLEAQDGPFGSIEAALGPSGES